MHTHTHTNAFTHTGQINSKQSWLMKFSSEGGSHSCDSKAPFNLNIFNTYSRKLNMELCVAKTTVFISICDGRMQGSHAVLQPDWLHTARSMEKRTCYKTEILWGNRNNTVAVAKPSNSICNDKQGHYESLLFLLTLGVYINNHLG